MSVIDEISMDQVELVKKWIDKHPDEKIPKFGTEEFDIFWKKATMGEDKQPATENAVENDEIACPDISADPAENHDEEPVSISKTIDQWTDEHPAITIGLFVLSVFLSGKLLQNFCSKAVYKGNMRTIKYLMKHAR